MTFNEIVILNVSGSANLITVTDSFMNIQSGQFQMVRTDSSYILQFLNSESVLSNSNFSQFYPTLIYSSISSMNISDCFFGFSYEKLGFLDVCAIYFEFNISFRISNSKFNSLSNNDQGSVNISLLLVVNF